MNTHDHPKNQPLLDQYELSDSQLQQVTGGQGTGNRVLALQKLRVSSSSHHADAGALNSQVSVDGCGGGFNESNLSILLCHE